MTQKSALFPSSHWGSNIGNAFFNLGTEYLLRNSANLSITPSDLPPTKAFGLTKHQQSNDCGYGYRLGRQEYLVLDGPMFDLSFWKLFGPYLKAAKELNIKVLLISTGGIEYSKEEIEHCRNVLKEYPPYLITTRDYETYLNYKDFTPNAYNGICSAWFVPEAYPGYTIVKEAPYIACCFDHTKEPDISFESEDVFSLRTSEVHHSKITKISRLLQKNLPHNIGGFDVLRPCHQVLNRQNWRLFFKPNAFNSQTPYGYLNIYRNAKLSVTDRLHASVATLAYGNPARLFLKSKRSFLLDRIGATAVTREVFSIDQHQLRSEKLKYNNWLSELFSK